MLKQVSIIFLRISSMEFLPNLTATGTGVFIGGVFAAALPAALFAASSSPQPARSDRDTVRIRKNFIISAAPGNCALLKVPHSPTYRAKAI